MTGILLCPSCGDDLIATTNAENKPIWSCGECGFTDEILVREKQFWKDAYDRGGWQR